MDELDGALIAALRRDARLPVAELARMVGTSRATAHERVKRLFADGVIEQATIRVDPAALGRPLRAFLLVGWQSDVEEDQRKVGRDMAKLSGVQRVHIVTGQHDFLVEVQAKDMDEVGRLIIDGLRPLPGVGGTESLLSFWSFESDA